MKYAFNPFTGTLDLVPAVDEWGRLSVVAGTTLSGHRIVTTDPFGKAVYASADDLDGRHGPFWLTLSAAITDDRVPIAAFGRVDEPSWAWTAQTALYLGDDGQLSEVPPSTPDLFSVQVAVALTPTAIFLDPTTPIMLAA